MDPETLLERWNANKHRPAWVRAHKAELERATGYSIPDGSLNQLHSWLKSHRSVITRKLNE